MGGYFLKLHFLSCTTDHGEDVTLLSPSTVQVIPRGPPGVHAAQHSVLGGQHSVLGGSQKPSGLSPR